jgi:hypothetical protein
MTTDAVSLEQQLVRVILPELLEMGLEECWQERDELEAAAEDIARKLVEAGWRPSAPAPFTVWSAGPRSRRE